MEPFEHTAARPQIADKFYVKEILERTLGFSWTKMSSFFKQNGQSFLLSSSFRNLMQYLCIQDVLSIHFTASRNFEEALALCKMLPPEDSSLQAAKEGSIHLRGVVQFPLIQVPGKWRQFWIQHYSKLFLLLESLQQI